MKTFIVLFFSVVVSAFSQQKFEREYKIKVTEVPAKAKEFINNCDFDKRIKWYAEESQDGKTIEAKSCKNKHYYSIEFDVNGNVLDVEKKIKWKEIDKKTQEKISSAFKKRFEKYRIKKIQLQWKTADEHYIELINNKSELNTTFEIVVKGTKNNTTKLFELLINKEGTILKELQFAPQNNDNLEF